MVTELFTADSLSHCNLEEIADVLNSCYYDLVNLEESIDDKVLSILARMIRTKE